MTKSWFAWSWNDSKKPNWLGGWRWSDRLSPKWYAKHGSWHVRALRKHQQKTFKMFEFGQLVENGWGVHQEDVRALCNQIEQLAIKVDSDKTTRNLKS